nr:MAG TPA: hypothetical protein [Caudoviricetes sp.]
MYVYWQNNSGGYSKEIRKTYKDNMLILPVKCMEATTHSYEHLAVADKEVIPKEVYFDGVEKGLDCSCCGDRWNRLDEWDTPKKIYIYEDMSEFEKSKPGRYSYYVILSELKKSRYWQYRLITKTYSLKV